LDFFFGFVEADRFKVDLATFLATFGAALDPFVEIDELTPFDVLGPFVDLEAFGFLEPFVLTC